MYNLNKKNKTRVINLLNIVADNEPMSCNRCGLTDKCPVYKYTTLQDRKCLKKGGYLSRDTVPSGVKYHRDAIDACFTTIMNEVSGHIVPDFWEVRIG